LLLGDLPVQTPDECRAARWACWGAEAKRVLGCYAKRIEKPDPGDVDFGACMDKASDKLADCVSHAERAGTCLPGEIPPTTEFVDRFVGAVMSMLSCGNGRLDVSPDTRLGAAHEVCDDDNLVNGDGCDATCRPEACGNGIVNPGETCDDGNT